MQIKSDVIVLESDEIADALCLEITKHSIRHLVIGFSSTGIFSMYFKPLINVYENFYFICIKKTMLTLRDWFCRKNLSLTKAVRDQNISATISEKAPNFCSVYVVADGKLQNLRPSESEPTVISIHNTNGSPITITEPSLTSSSLTIGEFPNNLNKNIFFPAL